MKENTNYVKRTGTLITRTVLYNPRITDPTVFNGNNNAKKNLRPIPQTVLSSNTSTNYPQNPAYATN